MRASVYATALVVLMLTVVGAATADTTVPVTLRLDDARRAAFGANPRRAVGTRRIDAAVNRARDAGRWNNPSLDAEVENWGGPGGADVVETTVGLTQRFELGGDRSARSAVAGSVAAAERAALEDYDRSLLETVTERFVTAWTAQEILWRLRESRRIAAAGVTAAQERLTAGAASPVEGVRARVQLSRVDAELARAEGNFRAACRSLALEWGEAEATFDSLALPAVAGASDPTPGDGWLAEHPLVAAADAELRGAEARRRAAGAARVPDADLSLGMRQFHGEGVSAWVAGVSLPLPLWNTRGGDLAATDADLDASNRTRAALIVRLTAELANARDRLSAARDAYEQLASIAEPGAHEALEVIQSGYRAGRYTYVELADAQRSALEAAVSVVEAAGEVWRSHARVESLVGSAASMGGAQ